MSYHLVSGGCAGEASAGQDSRVRDFRVMSPASHRTAPPLVARVWPHASWNNAEPILLRHNRIGWRRGGYVRSTSKIDAVPVEAKASCAGFLRHAVLNERAEMVGALQTAATSQLLSSYLVYRSVATSIPALAYGYAPGWGREENGGRRPECPPLLPG